MGRGCWTRRSRTTSSSRRPRSAGALARIAAHLPALEAFRLFLPVAAARDPFAFDLRPDAVRRSGARILRLLAGVAAGTRPARRAVAEVLQRHWAPRHGDVAALLQAALVLYADNGLNPSSFTARCVASAGSTPYAVVLGGARGAAGHQARRRLRARRGAAGGGRRRARGAPGGDRAAAARRADSRLRPSALPGRRPARGAAHAADRRGAAPLSEVALSRAVADAVAELMGEQPTIDFGVVTLCRALRLPAEASLSLLGTRPRRRLDRARPRAVRGRPRDPPARSLSRRAAGRAVTRGANGLHVALLPSLRAAVRVGPSLCEHCVECEGCGSRSGRPHPDRPKSREYQRSGRMRTTTSFVPFGRVFST